MTATNALSRSIMRGGTQMIWVPATRPEARHRHIDMGFEPGWNASADQLSALAQSLAAADHT